MYYVFLIKQLCIVPGYKAIKQNNTLQILALICNKTVSQYSQLWPSLYPIVTISRVLFRFGGTGRRQNGGRLLLPTVVCLDCAWHTYTYKAKREKIPIHKKCRECSQVYPFMKSDVSKPFWKGRVTFTLEKNLKKQAKKVSIVIHLKFRAAAT